MNIRIFLRHLLECCTAQHYTFAVFLGIDRHIKCDGLQNAGSRQHTHIPLVQAVKGNVLAVLGYDIRTKLSRADEECTRAVTAAVQICTFGKGLFY